MKQKKTLGLQPTEHMSWVCCIFILS